MNTMQRKASASRFGIIAALLAAIASLCFVCCLGMQQSAWADDAEEPLFTTGNITQIPFEKSADGITVSIDYEEAEEAGEEGTEEEAQSAPQTVVVKINTTADIEASKVVIEHDGDQIIETVPNGVLSDDMIVTLTLDNCDMIHEVSIYGPNQVVPVEEADNGDAAADEAAEEEAVNEDAAADTEGAEPADENAEGNAAADDASEEAATPVEEDPSAPAEEPINEPAEEEVIVVVEVEEEVVEETPEGNEQDDATAEPAADTEATEENNDGENADEEEPVEVVEYTVEFIANGHGGDAPEALTVEEGAYINLNDIAMSEKGYAFMGWHVDPECTEMFDESKNPITEDIKLYAKWVKICTVTFDMMGHGGSMAPIEVPEGECIAQGVATPTDSNYNFEYWMTKDGMPFDLANTAITEDITLYASWAKAIPTDPTPVVVEDTDASVGTFDIVVTKINIDNNTCLEGAEFTLKDKAGNVISSWTSGKSGVLIKGLKQNTTYVLTETKAPNGFSVEKPININYVVESGKPVVKIDQGGDAVVTLSNNKDGIASLNVKDTQGKKTTNKTTMPMTGDSQDLPVAGIALGGAAACAAAVAFMAYRKRKAA